MFKVDTASKRLASALILSVVLAGCASSLSNVPGTDLQQRIDAAHSRADHDSLGAYYDKEAVAAHAKAVEHRKMAKAYVGARNSGNIAAHCDAIARSYESIAADYESMGAEHRKMGAQVKS